MQYALVVVITCQYNTYLENKYVNIIMCKINMF